MAIDRRPIDQMVLDVGAEAFQRLVQLFEDETRGVVVALRTLLDTHDWPELGRQAHSLKHATSSFGLIDLAVLAARIEKAADAHLPAAAAEHLTALEAAAEPELVALEAMLRKAEI